MHRGRLFLLIAAIVGVVAGALVPTGHGVAPAQAGGSWSAWVYSQDTGKMVHVFPDGAAPVEMAFPLPPGTSQYPSAVTISRDGAYLAACLTDDAGNSSVRVYDIYGSHYIAAYIAPGPIVSCSLSRYSFSEDGTQLAFGILNHWPGEPASRPDWEVIVMQMNTSAILYHLDSNSPLITGLGLDSRGKLPFIVTFQMATGTFPGLITFKPVPWATEGGCSYDGLIWNLSDGSINQNGLYGKVGLDFLLPNSEAAWTDFDPTRPQGVLEGPGCAFNVIMYSNKAGALYPVYTNGTVLFGATFVDDGRRLAFSSYASGVTQWMALDRNGATTLLPSDLSDVYEVWGTLDGYAFLRNPSGGAPEVRYHRFSAGPSPDMFVAWSGLPGEYYRLIWVNPLAGGTGLPPFPPLAILGTPPIMITPTLPPPAVITLPAPPLPGGTLGVGGRARVNTTAGDMLRIRSGPGTSFAVAFQLANGTPVTLVEGPVSADGFSWWFIRTDDGRTGWGVEGVMDNGAYLQTLIPMP
jgi:hypothetical protein